MKAKFIAVLCALAGGTLSLWLVSARAHAQRQSTPATLYEGARLIVGDGSPAIENSAFVVEAGRFTRVGRRGDVQAAGGASRVDLTGKTVMPALIDTHEHVGTTRQAYIDHLRLIAYCGIALTTSMGRDLQPVFAVRDEAIPGAAQIMTSGRGLTGTLGTTPETIAAGRDGRLPEDEAAIEVQVWSPQQARYHVQDLAAQRVDFVKIWVDSRLGLETPLQPDVYRAAIDEAHKHHLRVFAHTWDLEPSKDLLRAGIDAFAHPIREKEVDAEFTELLKDRPNVFMQTNLQGTQFFTLTEDPPVFKDPLMLDLATSGDIKRLSAQIVDKKTRTHEGWPTTIGKVEFATRTYRLMAANTAKLHKAGVHYGVGTDGPGGYPTGVNFHVEMELLVRDVGLTPVQVIKMATLDGAKALEVDRHLGSIASGKDASFIVLDANPLDDITNTRRISKVVLGGHEVDRAAFKSYWSKRPTISTQD